MRRFLLLTFLVGVTAFSFYSAPVYAQPAPGPCSALNGSTFSTNANQAFVTPAFSFQPGDTVLYTLTYSFGVFDPNGVTLFTSLGASFNPVTQTTFSSSPLVPAATLAYTFTSPQTTQLEFDWSFTGSGSFSPHTINTTINCGQEAATIPTLGQWGLLIFTLALAAAGIIHLRRR